MSKMRLQWLWIVIGIELLVMAGLVVWAVAIRQPETPSSQKQTPAPQQQQSLKPPVIELVKVAEGFTQPVAIVSTPDGNDARIFVVEQTGTIRSLNGEKVLDETAFLDIKSKIKTGGEMGLLGLAFHPKVSENKFFYINYVDKSLNTIIARYTISATTGRADPASEKIILKVKQPYDNHNGGDLAFGPDGYLYIGLGDGGSGGDPQNRAQNKNDLLGKMLRINVDAGDPYTNPADNPYISGGGKAEIWATGLRNPWRFSFDSKTGDLYIADVGQSDYEEINFQAAKSKGGQNYGWRCYEGGQTFNADGCLDTSAYTKPVLQYDHGDSRCSVTGGYVYRGGAYPALAGQYFYGDFCSGQLFFAKQTDGNWQSVLGKSTSFQITAFGQDAKNELYLADRSTGAIYQITDSANGL